MMTRALFIADQFADSNRTENDRHPGGAELTDEAAIEACPWPIELVTCADFTEAILADVDVVVLGNTATGNSQMFSAIAAHGRHVLFEHDVRICRWRGNFPSAIDPIHRFAQKCICPHLGLRSLYDSALGAIFLTHRQLSVFEDNPTYACAQNLVVGSSLFSQSFFDRVERDHRGKRDGWVVFGSQNAIKGFAPARDYCLQRDNDPTVIRDMEPDEVLELLETSERFVYLPIGLEPAGRMPVEARFLGCDVVTNENVGVTGEAWWALPDTQALEVLADAPARFWRLIETLMIRSAHGTDSTPGTPAAKRRRNAITLSER